VSKEKTFAFDKFMEDLEDRTKLEEEKRRRAQAQEEEWHARRLLRKYREHPMNLRDYENKR